MTGGKINGTINIVRSTKGCLACMISGMGMPELYKLNNVTVLDRDEGLLSVGDRQSFFVS